MKNVIITGSTGMIGGIVLRECLNDPEIVSITSIVRKPTGLQHTKLVEIIHDDFTDFSSVEHLFHNIHIAYYCIGVYTGSVPRDKFRHITVDFTKAFAATLKKNSPDAVFCFLSGQGADRKEKSRMMFAKDKGIAENFLIGLNFKGTYIFRPAYIYPVVPRKEPNLSYRMMRRLYPFIKTIYPKGVITSEQLGKAIFKTGLHGADKIILENDDIKSIN